MNVDIFLVSCAKHFPWLRYALQSINRFGSGFRQVKVMIPNQDLEAMNPLLSEIGANQNLPIRVAMFDDWPGKGFLRHEHVIMTADEWTDADFVLHTDSDCLFVEPFSPADYFINGLPVLMHGSYDWLKNEVQANLDMWRVAVEAAIGPPVTQETMRRHPAVHPRKIYPLARHCMVKYTNRGVEDYIQSCENAYPQSFAEFPTLGAVAWRCCHADYHWIDHEQLHKTGTPWPNSKLTQFWGHGPVDEPQEPVFKGKPYRCTPKQLLAEL